MYIAHPTHGAGTRPKRTQLTTAAWKTTLNAGQCVRQPREGRGRNRQTPPQKKKQQRGEGGGAKTAHSHQTARQHHQRRPNRLPEGSEDRTPKEAQGDHPAKTSNTKPGTAAHREKGHQNKQKHTPRKRKKKRKASNPARKKGDGVTRTTRPGTGTAKKKSAKNTPRRPSQEGLGTAGTRAQHTRPQRTPEPETAGGKQGAQQPHTSHKQAETESQPQTPQTADTRGTTPQTVPKHTHPRPEPGLAGLTKPTPNRGPDPNKNAAQQKETQCPQPGH